MHNENWPENSFMETHFDNAIWIHRNDIFVQYLEIPIETVNYLFIFHSLFSKRNIEFLRGYFRVSLEPSANFYFGFNFYFILLGTDIGVVWDVRNHTNNLGVRCDKWDDKSRNISLNFIGVRVCSYCKGTHTENWRISRNKTSFELFFKLLSSPEWRAFDHHAAIHINSRRASEK